MAALYRAASAHGRVHAMTLGRAFRMHGVRYKNTGATAFGKADCGTIVSGGAGHLTDEPVNCPRCLAAGAGE